METIIKQSDGTELATSIENRNVFISDYMRLSFLYKVNEFLKTEEDIKKRRPSSIKERKKFYNNNKIDITVERVIDGN